MKETVNFTASERVAVLAGPDDFDGWRTQARQILMARVHPSEVIWRVPGEEGDLFASSEPSPPPVAVPDARQPIVSRAFLDLAAKVACHRDRGRFDLLYRLLWRLQRNARLLEDKADNDVRRLDELARAVRRDIHKMRAFVRFRSVAQPDGTERYVAWFEPEHHILRANAAFFVNRFAGMHWSILTPNGALHWDGATLQEGPPATRGDAPGEDPIEELWSRYYASIFNPARLKIDAMLKEMPRKYWKNMPETALVPALIAGAQAREAAMVEAGRDLFEHDSPPTSLEEIASAIRSCRRCAIGCNGTAAVGSEGAPGASLMIVGEQPGDVEEREGRPFVGPAGQLLMSHLEKAGLDRSRAYVTNAVKHFKFLPRGKRRMHQTPTAREIDTCRWWLDGERSIVKPRLVLALGASAARGLLGKTISVQKERGAPIDLPDGSELWVTTHPSYLLRLPEENRPAEEKRFQDDLRAIAERLAALESAAG
jgi:probable DNA metabolism protein